MTGPEMLIANVLKLLKIDDSLVTKALGDMSKVGAVAQALDTKMDEILLNQKLILELLRPDVSDIKLLAQPAQENPEESING